LATAFRLIAQLPADGIRRLGFEPPPAHRPEFPARGPSWGHGRHSLGRPEIREGGEAVKASTMPAAQSSTVGEHDTLQALADKQFCWILAVCLV